MTLLWLLWLFLPGPPPATNPEDLARLEASLADIRHPLGIDVDVRLTGCDLRVEYVYVRHCSQPGKIKAQNLMLPLREIADIESSEGRGRHKNVTFWFSRTTGEYLRDNASAATVPDWSESDVTRVRNYFTDCEGTPMQVSTSPWAFVMLVENNDAALAGALNDYRRRFCRQEQ